MTQTRLHSDLRSAPPGVALERRAAAVAALYEGGPGVNLPALEGSTR